MFAKAKLFALVAVMAALAASCSSDPAVPVRTATAAEAAAESTAEPTAAPTAETVDVDESPVAPDETFGITPETLQQFGIGAQVPALAGVDLRGRVITFEPGGAPSEHDHASRPGLVYVLKGAVTEHRNGESRVFVAGESWFEDTTAEHWVENHTDSEAVIITADLVETSGEDGQIATGTVIDFDLEAPAEASGVGAEELALFDVGEQLPRGEGVNFRLRRITFLPDGSFPQHPHASQPGIGYVLEGTFTESRPDLTRDLDAGESWSEDAGTEHWVLNRTDEQVVVLVFDLVVPAE